MATFARNGSSGSGAEGNTKPPKRSNASKRFTGTGFPHSKAEMDHFFDVLETDVRIGAACGQEEWTEDKRLHCQFYFELLKKGRPTELKNFFPCKPHYEKARGTRFENLDYCTDPAKRRPGGRVFANFRDRRAKPLKKLYVWQQHVFDYLKGPIHPREILWVYGAADTGKTALMKHLVLTLGARVVSGHTRHVTAVVSKTCLSTSIYIFPLAYAAGNRVCYEGMEAAKDCFGSAHFGTKGLDMFVAKPAHVVVIANFAPAEHNMSKDRFRTFNIDDLNTWRPTIEDPEEGFADTLSVSPTLTLDGIAYAIDPISAPAVPVGPNELADASLVSPNEVAALPRYRERDGRRDRDRTTEEILDMDEEEFTLWMDNAMGL